MHPCQSHAVECESSIVHTHRKLAIRDNCCCFGFLKGQNKILHPLPIQFDPIPLKNIEHNHLLLVIHVMHAWLQIFGFFVSHSVRVRSSVRKKLTNASHNIHFARNCIATHTAADETVSLPLCVRARVCDEFLLTSSVDAGRIFAFHRT